MLILKNLREGLGFNKIFHVTPEAVLAFAEATGDRNPIHFSDEAAQKAGFQGKIAHGQLVVAMANTLLTDHIDNILLREQTVRYKGGVPVGESVLVAATITSPPLRRGPLILVEWAVTFSCKSKIVYTMEAKTLIPVTI